MGDRIFTLEILGKAILCFPAAGLREAQSLVKEEWLRNDLREIRSVGVPIWDGISKLIIRNATLGEADQFEKEGPALKGDELPIVYLIPLY